MVPPETPGTLSASAMQKPRIAFNSIKIPPETCWLKSFLLSP